MRLIKKRHHSALNLPTLRLEGGLFLPDQLEKAALGQAKYQSEADYQTPKGLKLKDDFSRAFQIATAQWKHFSPSFDRKDIDAINVTTDFVNELLRDALAYAQYSSVPGITLGERHFPINAILNENIPLVIAPHNLGLDEAHTRFAIAGSGSRKKSAFQLAQEFLNASVDHLWAIVTNGRQLRLLRDAATLTRPSFLEFDLEDMLGAQRFAEFEMCWRLLHASRSGNGGESVWEAWRTEGQQEGTRVRDGLRRGVTDALLIFGSGFIQHPANETLRLDLLEGRLSKEAYFEQILRLVYRFIFLFTIEERGVLHTDDDSKDAIAARRAYADGYALSRMRESCLRRRSRNQFDDRWSSLKIVFRGLADGQPLLALPALGGLFDNDQCPNLDNSSLSNAALMDVMKQLRWSNFSGSLAPVDYRNMGPEELGSVYESLLELVPEADIHSRTFGFVGLTSEGSTAGNARKTSGSYYTPDSLVQELIKSALDPVIEQRLASQPDNPTEALLSIRVIDPACGSGHFLLAAARRLAEHLAALRATDGAVKPQDYRHALREVIARCIFGVDRNPMALELARTALWLEGFEEGKPLSFLDHHLQVGDALLGLTDLKALEMGIPKDAYKPLSGDDKETCSALAKDNAKTLKSLVSSQKHGQMLAQTSFELNVTDTDGLAALQNLEALPADTSKQIAAKETAYQDFLHIAKTSRLVNAANLLVGAFLLTKTADQINAIPLSETLVDELANNVSKPYHARQLAAAEVACQHARVLHWPLRFPQVFAAGGFDCVLGNPPWERIKLQEEEFFASKNRDVAQAKNKAERSQRIQWLSEGMLAQHLFPELGHTERECEAEKRLFQEFINARRTAEAASVFAHVKGDDGGRYPLTGIGDVNTYALFSETISQITSDHGRAGFIVPTGIATDDSTKAFFANITQNGRLVSLYDIENKEAVFPSVHRSFKFCLLTLGKSQEAAFAFFLTQTAQLADTRRCFILSGEDFARINPNTLTCPVFRSRMDAELTRKIYQRVPVLIQENASNFVDNWGLKIKTRLFHMAEDSHLFIDKNQADAVPLIEAKLVHIYDHRWATYSSDNETREITNKEKKDPYFLVKSRYWVSFNELEFRSTNLPKDFVDAFRENNVNYLEEYLLENHVINLDESRSALNITNSARELISSKSPKYWFGWRKITNAANERTFISFLTPFVAAGDSMYLIQIDDIHSPRLKSALHANWSSIVFDWIVRQKIGGSNLSFYIVKQLPVLQPEQYTDKNLSFIVPRVLELTYTSYDMRLWAKDLGYEGDPFVFEPDRRAILRAELDAYYAELYGLTRDELRYILDPADVVGKGYPSETFRVLKSNEIKEFDEYRTQQLVLEAWDKLERGELH